MIALVLACSIASAQDAPAPTAYERGLAALEAGDTEGALSAFREAFESEPTPEHALAVAATLQERDALGEAISLYDRLLTGELGALAPAQSSAIAEARARAAERQAVLMVSVEGAGELRVELDGVSVGSVASGAVLTLRVDPGEHRVTGTSAAEPVVVTVAASEQRPVRLTIAEPPAQVRTVRVVPVETRPPPDESAPAWPWILGVTGGVLLVAGAVVLVLLVTADSGFSEAPIPNVTGLRF